MSPAIRVSNLSKCYQLGEGSGAKYKTLRESVAAFFSTPLNQSISKRDPKKTSEFHALRDVSFEVQPGAVLGVIGRNGAGKSTLLKILSRITEPTSGKVMMRGRIASLLEVGTGFHSELTGRENIYLNGAILGMNRQEVNRNFAKIVSFAEVESFLDTPVKRYSSGMYVRLAFAVAAHLEPEILIVDEVLAVGDIAFQNRCLGRLREVSKGGRTVLFVSHNMAAVDALCDTGILLDNGRVVSVGPVGEIVHAYHGLIRSGISSTGDSLANLERPGRLQKLLQHVSIIDAKGDPTDSIGLGESLRIRIAVKVGNLADSATLGIGIDNIFGQRVLSLHTPASASWQWRTSEANTVECRIPFCPLVPGEYWVKLAVSSNWHVIDEVERVISFSVNNAVLPGEGRGFHRGLCVADAKWELVDN